MSRNMIDYLVLTNEGSCVKVRAGDLNSALEFAIKSLQWEDIVGFIMDELSLVEWKTDEGRFVKDYGLGSVTQFDVDSPYQLEPYLKIKATKKPTRQLAEEFDDIDLL